jgi:hypothetical protein
VHGRGDEVDASRHVHRQIVPADSSANREFPRAIRGAGDKQLDPCNCQKQTLCRVVMSWKTTVKLSTVDTVKLTTKTTVKFSKTVESLTSTMLVLDQ